MIEEHFKRELDLIHGQLGALGAKLDLTLKTVAEDTQRRLTEHLAQTQKDAEAVNRNFARVGLELHGDDNHGGMSGRVAKIERRLERYDLVLIILGFVAATVGAGVIKLLAFGSA